MVFEEVDIWLGFLLDGVEDFYTVWVYFKFGLSLSFEELGLEIFLLELIGRALAPLSFLEFEISG